MIYKEPTIYNQGLSNNDVIKIVSNSEWVEIANKIGTVTAPAPSNVQIYWNKTLSLIHLRFYFRFSSTDSGKRIGYEFNNDIPGYDETTLFNAMFSIDTNCYVFFFKSGLMRCYPYDTQDSVAHAISVDGDNFEQASFSGLFRFNSTYTEELQNYLDTH